MRILYFMNVSTNPEHLQADSGFQVIRQLIEAVNKKRSDIHWYLVAPVQTKRLTKHIPRVTVLPYPFTHWAIQNRFHFDFIQFKKTVKLDYDIDLIFNSQPELTGNLYSVFNPALRDFRFSIPIINYLHWLAVPETPKYQESCFVRQLEGMLYAKHTGLNSQWAKKIFERHVEQLVDKHPLVSRRIAQHVNATLQPMYLGSPLREIDAVKDKSADHFARNGKERFYYRKLFEQVSSTKTIVFNHRLMQYTGAAFFLKMMKQLSTQRKDFLVWLTDPNMKSFFKRANVEDLPNLLRVEQLPWRVYIALLRQSYVSCACHPTYSAWSLSCVDTMSVERPVLVPKAFAFPEIVGENYSLTFANDRTREKSFLQEINYLLDNEDVARQLGAVCRRRIKSKYDWDIQADNWLQVIDANLNLQYGNETDAMRQLAKVIQKAGMLSKRQIFKRMKWSYDFNTKITWGRYRNYLLSNGFLDDVSTSKVFFTPQTGGQLKLFVDYPSTPMEMKHVLAVLRMKRNARWRS